MARVVPFSEARAHLTDLLDEIEAIHQHVVITRNGRPAAVVIAEDEYEAILETLDVLADEGALADLRASEADVKAGRLIEWDVAKRKFRLA